LPSSIDDFLDVLKKKELPMICDVHAHYIPKNFSDFMGDRFPTRVGVPVKRGIARHPVSDSPQDIQGRLELMDAAGVEKQVLSPNHPPYLPDEKECVTAIQMLNDGYTELTHRYPQRIASYVMLPLPHIDAALKEMERGARPVGLRRRQHAHHLPQPLGRRNRVRADLRGDEPARRGPLRASVGNRHLLALHRRLRLADDDLGNEERAGSEHGQRAGAAPRLSIR
jgi:Amidohydrolase